ncbi:MAG: hypothetical protein JXR03_03080 [Cyclobacteriaceae bacterium]
MKKNSFSILFFLLIINASVGQKKAIDSLLVQLSDLEIEFSHLSTLNCYDAQAISDTYMALQNYQQSIQSIYFKIKGIENREKIRERKANQTLRNLNSSLDAHLDQLSVVLKTNKGTVFPQFAIIESDLSSTLNALRNQNPYDALLPIPIPVLTRDSVLLKSISNPSSAPYKNLWKHFGEPIRDYHIFENLRRMKKENYQNQLTLIDSTNESNLRVLQYLIDGLNRSHESNLTRNCLDSSSKLIENSRAVRKEIDLIRTIFWRREKKRKGYSED